MRSNPPRALIKRRRSTNVQYKIKKSLICVIRWSLLGDYSCLRESAQPRLKSRELRTMMAKANLSRTLVVAAVVVAAAVALFGVGPRTAEPQTTTASTTTYYKVQDLGTLGGVSYATGINDSGKVVGWSSTSIAGSTVSRAFLYDESATPKMQDLGDLGNNYDTRANDINNSGKVVGYSYASNGGQLEQHGFLYDSTNGMKDLNDLIPADSGGTISEARAINTDGKIAATGYKEGVGQRALLLTPTGDTQPPDDTEVPSPPSITSPQNNTYDSDGSFSVSGSAEAGSTVELFEGTTSKGKTKADSSSGAWSIALSGLSEGAHTYTAKAKDAAGNISSASDSVTVTVDKTAPKVDSVNPKEDATGVAPGVNVTAIFSEGMRDASVKSAFKLYKKGTTTALGASVSYDTTSTSRQATLDPSANLKRGSTYKAVVSVGAQDLAGNPLAQQKVWFFTVG